jgi:glycosyltransferase involved in cell wall biosynthesis
MKKVTVIIPSKNRFDFTSQALSSIYSQDLNSNKIELEVIVVDDLSSPSLESVLGKKFPLTKFIKNKTHFHGPGPSRNIGIKFSTGDYLAFLDNDDQWEKNFITTSIDAIQKNNGVSTLCLTSEYFDGNFPLSYKVKIRILNLIRIFVLLYCYLFNGKRLIKSGFYLAQISHMIFDKKKVQNIRFNERTVAAEDWEYVVEVTKSFETIIIPKKMVNFRYEPRSNTHSDKVVKNKWNAYKELLDRVPLTHKQGLLYKLFLKYIGIFQS